MKFVCAECDELMQLRPNGLAQDRGTLSVTFACPSCDWGVVMLTNPQETQMVRSLGVKIGPGAVEQPPAPMETIQSHLMGSPHPATEGSGGKCPFTDMVRQATEDTDGGA